VLRSRAPVGSSAKTISGPDTSARAIATRCCWPPDSCAGRTRARSPSPTWASARSTASGANRRPASRLGSATFWATVIDGIRFRAWNTNPTRLRRSFASRRSGSLARSTSSHDTDPPVGRSIPAAQCSNVLLPEPDGPITAVNVPGANRSVTWSSACTVGPGPDRPYTRLTSSSRIMPRSSAAGIARSIEPPPESAVRESAPNPSRYRDRSVTWMWCWSTTSRSQKQH
jgi:hypothetical protein